MTTIAVKDGVIAADTRATGGHYLEDDTQKIFQLNKDQWVGLAGRVSRFQSYIKWLKSDRTELPPQEVEALILNRDGTTLVYEMGEEEPVHAGRQAAIGSGSQSAMIAMDMGDSARDAILRVVKRDSEAATGGKVVVRGPKEAKKLAKSKRRKK